MLYLSLPNIRGKDYSNGKYLDLNVLYKLDDINSLQLTRRTLIHINIDNCSSCNSDKKIFGEYNVKSRFSIVGLNWLDQRGVKNLDALNSVYSDQIYTPNTDLFVKLGLCTVPVTLIVGINGQILYSHYGQINKSILENEITPILISGGEH